MMKIGKHQEFKSAHGLSATVASYEVFQFSLGSMQSYTRSKLSHDDVTAVKALITSDHHVNSHAPYCLNLATVEDDKAGRAFQSLQSEIDILAELPIPTVIHLGSGGSVELLAERLAALTMPKGKPRKTTVLLENSSGSKKGTKHGASFEDLYQLHRRLPSEHFAFCLDTCHLYVHGEYDCTSAHDVCNFMSLWSSQIGMDRLKLIHLNDSAAARGTHHDKHANISEGHIWNEDQSGAQLIGHLSMEYNIPMIVEIGSAHKTISIMNDLCL